MRIQLQWDQSLKIGVAAMDRDHERLVNAMAVIDELDTKKAGKGAIKGAIDKLAALVVAHFQAEEAYMQSIDFPGLAVHKRIHEDLLQNFTKHKAAYEKGDGSVTDDFHNFLVCWLRAHIKGIDAKYAEHKTPVKSR